MKCYKCLKEITDTKYSYNRIGSSKHIICYTCCGQQTKASLIKNSGGILRAFKHKSGRRYVVDASGTLKFEVESIEEHANSIVYWFKINNEYWYGTKHSSENSLICRKYK